MSPTEVVPLYQSILGVVGFSAAVVGPILLARWGQLRRAHENAVGQADTTKGAESIINVHGRDF